MSLLSTLQTRTRAPIIHAELMFQQRSMVSRPRGLLRRVLRWPWKILMVIAITDAVVVLLSETLAALLGYDFAWLPQRLQTLAGVVLFLIPLVVLVPFTVILHFRTQLQTLTLASNVISREKRGGTWDLLLLTHADAQQIVRGKWWATLKHVWRSYLLLALLRAGTLLWAALEISRFSMMTYPTFQITINPRYYSPVAVPVLVAAAVVMVFTLLNAPYTAAAGTLGSVFTRGGGTSLTLAIAIRILVLIGLALIVGLAGHWLFLRWLSASALTGNYDYYSRPWTFYQALISGAFTLVDNGLVLGAMVASYNHVFTYYSNYINAFTAGGVLAFGILILLTWLALQIAQRAILRQGALVPQRDWWARMKKKKLADDAAAAD